MAYLHGTYGKFNKSIGLLPIPCDTIPVYVGTAPVNLVRGYEKEFRVNAPVKMTDIINAQKSLGYSSDWDSFTLCEAFNIHFSNSIENVAPVVAINVLDPDIHRKTEATNKDISFVNGRAVLVSDTIILDTLAIADKVEGKDYVLDYDFTKNAVIIDSIGEDIKGSVQASYNEVDCSMITNADIIGGVTASGVFTGLGCVSLVYPELGLIPNIICAPKHSSETTVYKAMVQAATKINGHWDAVINVDIPINTNSTIEDAVKWRVDNDYTSERAKAYFPKWKFKDGTVFHLSVIATWLMCLVDATHKGVPMETPSNKKIPSGKQYFGEGSTNRGYDQQTANKLNENGITTAVYWGGATILWGPHTAAYTYGQVSDARAIFDSSIRMMMHVTNSFQSEHAIKTDAPMTRALADTIKNREQEKLDALVAVGALLGSPKVEFKESENPTTNLMEGDFVWTNTMTPTPPFKSGTLTVAYTDEGFSSYYE